MESNDFEKRRRSNTMPSQVIRNLRTTSKTPAKHVTSSPKPSAQRVRKISAPACSILKKQSSFENSRDDAPSHRQVSLLREETNPLSSSLDSLETLGARRSPLPRGSNLYESVMKEFGRDEEERDSLSPLPSPDQKRKFTEKLHPHRHAHVHQHSSQHSNGDVSSSNSQSASSESKKHIQWSQDIKVRRK